MTPQDGREEIEAEIARLRDEADVHTSAADGWRSKAWAASDLRNATLAEFRFNRAQHHDAMAKLKKAKSDLLESQALRRQLDMGEKERSDG